MESTTTFAAVELARFFGQSVRSLKEASILESIGDFDACVTLKDADERERWMMILPDVLDSTQWRTLNFDINGFSGHAVFATKDEAVESAVRCGFHVRDDEALDRIQNLPSFMLGNYCCDQIARLNCGEITYKQYLQLVKEYKVLHSLTDSFSLVI